MDKNGGLYIPIFEGTIGYFPCDSVDFGCRNLVDIQVISPKKPVERVGGVGDVELCEFVTLSAI